METDYKWIAQDKDGVIAKFVGHPIIIGNHWRKGMYGEYKRISVGKHNPNWKESVIDLETDRYQIVDGILMNSKDIRVATTEAVETMSKHKLTDTELLDAIVDHELLVNVGSNGVRVISGAPSNVTITNKKGNIRKAIKKWLRKNT